MRPADRWREELEAWTLPDELLEAVEDSPYGWSQELWKRRRDMAQTEPPSETIGIVEALLPAGGSILDVGVGRGRASLPVARRGHALVGVDEDADMLEGFVHDARELGLTPGTVRGRWPDVAPETPIADVVIAAHVVYNVAEIVPFVEAMLAHSTVAVVLELTDRHPWAGLKQLYLDVHQLDRPNGPSVDLLVEVLTEITGDAPTVHRWDRRPQVWYADWDELLEHYGRRLVVPRTERSALRGVLQRYVVETGGRLSVGNEPSRFATVVIGR